MRAVTTLTAAVQDTEPPRVLVTASDLGAVPASLLANNRFDSPAGVTTGWTTNPAVVSGYTPGPVADLPADEGTTYLLATLTGADGDLLSQAAAAAAGTTLQATAGVAASEDTTHALTLTLTATAAGAPVGDPVTDTLDGVWGWQDLATDPLLLPPGADGILVTLTVAGATAAAQVAVDHVVLISVSDAPGTIDLYRVVDGARTPVRGAAGATPSAGSMLITDNEAPFGVEVSYVLTQSFEDGTIRETASGVARLHADLPWLTNPITGDGVALTIVDWPELAYAARHSIIPVAGRVAPVAISDVRTSAASSMVVLTRTREQLVALRTLLATGDVILARPVCEAVEGDYLAVGDVSEARYRPTSPRDDPRPAGSDWRRLVTLAVQAVDQPSPAIPATGDTLLDLSEYVPGTLADLAASFPDPDTLLTIAQTALKEVGGRSA